MTNLIEARGLIKRFHEREVVKGIDIEVHQGEVLALIGTNGAGKSTTIAMLLDVYKPDAGNIIRWRNDFKDHVGIQLQSTPFFDGYSAEENLLLFAALYKIKLKKSEASEILEKCGLRDAAKTLAIRLSGGQQKRLAIAVTTIHHPDLIVLDEPAAGLDPRARQEIRTMITDLAKDNVTILFSSHDMEEVKRISDRIILLHEGLIVAEGQPGELLEKHKAEDLDSLYLKLTETVG